MAEGWAASNVYTERVFDGILEGEELVEGRPEGCLDGDVLVDGLLLGSFEG